MKKENREGGGLEYLNTVLKYTSHTMSNYWWLPERTWRLVTITHRKFGPIHHNPPNPLVMTRSPSPESHTYLLQL